MPTAGTNVIAALAARRKFIKNVIIIFVGGDMNAVRYIRSESVGAREQSKQESVSAVINGTLGYMVRNTVAAGG